MKKAFFLFLAAAGLIFCVYLVNRTRSVTIELEAPNHSTTALLERTVPTVAPRPIGPQIGTAVPPAIETWVENHSAGLVISQTFDPVTNEPTGTVTAGNVVTDLGETPPVYRYQLQATGYPIMLGEKHQRKSFEIQATSLIAEPNGTAKKWPLSVTYPRWPGLHAGLESSGGFVFKKDENPLAKIGVLVPRVIPEVGESASDFDWKIEIRINDKPSDIDVRNRAKPQSMGSDVTVLMATHPDDIPASALVVWFKFEKDGTVSLMAE